MTQPYPPQGYPPQPPQGYPPQPPQGYPPQPPQGYPPQPPQGYPPQPPAPPQYGPPPQGYAAPPAYGPPMQFAPPVAYQPPPPVVGLDDFNRQRAGGGKGLSFAAKDKPIGTRYIIMITRAVTNSDVTPVTGMAGTPEAGRIQYNTDGSPRIQLVLPGAMVWCADPQNYPNGECQFYLNARNREELARAMAEVGCDQETISRSAEPGSLLDITLIERRSSGRGTPANILRIVYVRPDQAVQVAQGIQMPAPPQAPPAPPMAPQQYAPQQYAPQQYAPPANQPQGPPPNQPPVNQPPANQPPVNQPPVNQPPPTTAAPQATPTGPPAPTGQSLDAATQAILDGLKGQQTGVV